MRHYFVRRAERGLFVFAEPPNPPYRDRPLFWLTFRAIDRAAMSTPVVGPELQHVPITLQTWSRVRFCPWCGRDVERFYAETWRQLVDEAESAAHGQAATRAVCDADPP